MSGLGLQASVLQLFRNVVQDRQEEDATVDLQVGKTVHSGLPRRMRTELWMSVLLRKGVGTAAAKQYRTMLAKVRPQLQNFSTQSMMTAVLCHQHKLKCECMLGLSVCRALRATQPAGPQIN